MPGTGDRPSAAVRMRHVLGAEGEAALSSLMAQRPLLAFDFDGTLAPIVARPGDARLSRAVATRLAALAERLPVAIVSGRALADLQDRLGFTPTYLIGNHGAEDAADPAGSAAWTAALEPLRTQLARQRAALESVGVTVEDKGPSLALHYRLAPDRAPAQQAIQRLLDSAAPGLKVFGGKCVVNVTAADCPDKAAAVLSLVARSGCDCALFAGDDVNDEPVFIHAPAHWLTLRVGRDDASSRARYFLDSPAEMAMLLERLLAHLDSAGAA